ncbi:MAG: methyltransferase [Bradymonadaceae bacterium]
MLPDFSTRSDESERIDDADLDGEPLRKELQAVDRFNRWFGGVRASTAGLASLVPDSRRALRILDVGTGGGALARRLFDWADERGHDPKLHGIDLLDGAIDLARRRHGDVEGLTFAADDLFELDRRFDVVHASLVLHHFPGERAREALARMRELADVGVVVNDLHRHPVHYGASRVVAPLVTSSEIARHDGPLSILRSFTRPELEQLAVRAGFDHADITWKMPFRWVLTGA